MVTAHAFMKDMLESNEQHDYESLTSIANEQHIAVNMGAMGERRGLHDYACIGAAPVNSNYCIVMQVHY